MGRDAFSGESKLTVKKGKMVQAMEALGFVVDEAKSVEQNLQDCLADQLISFDKKDGRGSPIFFVDDAKPRTTLVLKLTQMLDECEWIPEIKERWLASLTQSALG